jgi:UDP-glucose 4-epimerase
VTKSEEIALPNITGQRVVVTGATGFIGTYLSRKLYDLGAVVTSTSRSSVSLHNFETVRIDLLRKMDVQALLSSKQANIVYHLASPVNPTRDESLVSKMELGVIQTTKNVVEACLSAGVRLVVTGTCEEYGSSHAPFSEESELNPVSPYSFAKAQMTRFVMDTCHETELRATVVRPFLTYGPGQRSARLIPSAIRAALDGKPFEMTRGEQTREFNYISDIGDGIIASASEAAVGQIINIGGGEELSVIDVVRRIYTLCGADLSLIRAGAIRERSGEVSRFYGTHSKARALLGHSPKIDLDEGLKATIAWWREQ